MKAVILNKNDIKTIILLGSSIKKRYKYKFWKKTKYIQNIILMLMLMLQNFFGIWNTLVMKQQKRNLMNF